MHDLSFSNRSHDRHCQTATNGRSLLKAFRGSSASTVGLAVGFGRDSMASHGYGWICPEDQRIQGMGHATEGTGGWTIRNQVVAKPRTQSALAIKSEGDSKTWSRTRTLDWTSVRNV